MSKSGGCEKVKFKRAGSKAVNSITYQVSDVGKLLDSVSRVSDKGNAVIFRSGSYILNEASFEKIPTVEERGTSGSDEDSEENGGGESELKNDMTMTMTRPVKAIQQVSVDLALWT